MLLLLKEKNKFKDSTQMRGGKKYISRNKYSQMNWGKKKTFLSNNI